MPAASSPTSEDSRIFHLNSFEKISGLPGVSSTINLTQELYGKVKESTTTSKLIFELAEHSVQKAAQLAEPVAMTMEKPIRIADAMVCDTIDIVGNRIGKAREAPQKFTNVITSVKPAMDYAVEVGSFGVQTVSYLYSQLGSRRSWSEQQTETEPESESEYDRTNEPEKHDRGTQTMMTGNVHKKVKMFSEG